MIRIAVRVRREHAELVLAELLTLAPGGLEEREEGDVVEYAVYGAEGELPALPALRAAAGDALVEVRRDGFRPAEAAVTALAVGTTRLVAVALERALPPGQLRGEVRSARGRPIAASLTIEPSGVGAATDEAGRFAVDLPPGEHAVTIRAPGRPPQRRRVRIEQDGVTILNVVMAR